ncbi:PstS family phosphate ABC transporter substrate-binding protein [Adhaeribacter terreus]|uniref:PstS family phosphate ABC transporter substrate-binding protein n=1 Tax=Adhaeribacter terreus TaxID=529703 RepID=A0ABW0E8B1_9BACT
MKNIKAFSTLLLTGGLFTVLLGSCNQSGSKGPSDTPTSGSIKISVDETFKPIIETQLNVFHKLYKNAKINATYAAESEAIKALLQDSARLAIVSRPLTPSETQVFEKARITPRVTKIATDGIALILNPENTDTLLSLPQLREIFSGKATSWKQVNPASKLGNIAIVFDNANSSTARFVRDSITNKAPLPPTAYASNSIPSVIDYVTENKNSIGVIGANWISDFDDSTAVGFINKVKVVAVSREHTPAKPDNYVQPYQAYLVQKSYPLFREVYIISREARAGLGTGFVSFSAGDKGQRIVLKAGLAPARGVVRLVEVKR